MYGKNILSLHVVIIFPVFIVACVQPFLLHYVQLILEQWNFVLLLYGWLYIPWYQMTILRLYKEHNVWEMAIAKM